MSTPAIIYIVVTGTGLLAAAHQHGKPRSNQNFWTTALGVAIAYALLTWGGFFK